MISYIASVKGLCSFPGCIHIVAGRWIPPAQPTGGGVSTTRNQPGYATI